jgi:hypothetical protein
LTKNEQPLLECFLNDQKIITSEAYSQPVYNKYYDYSSKVIIQLNPVDKTKDKILHDLDFADPEISCDFTYDKSISRL